MTPGRDAKALLRVHRAFLLLLAVFVPLAIHFAWHLDIATLGDDSVSYLALASYYSGHVSDPLLARWTWWSAHFPPLFPLLLAATGAWRDLLVAHLLVALCSVAGFILTYRLALLVLEEADAALGVAFLFAITPSAWVNTLGIMSDPLYLATTVGALAVYESRLTRPGSRDADWLLFGLLVALGCLTRLVGMALVVALVANELATALRRRKRPRVRELAIALWPTAVLVGGWMWLRPTAGFDQYHDIVQLNLRGWIHSFGEVAPFALGAVRDAWIASFTIDSSVSPAMRIVFAGVGALAVAGAAMSAWRGRIHGWYALGFTAILVGWVFGEETTRRLIYPIVPVALIQAALALREVLKRLPPSPRALRYAAPALVTLTILLALPGMVLVQRRSLDRDPVLDGFAYSYADFRDYYESHGPDARARAAGNLASLAGLRALPGVTPRDAKILWFRPEYLAFLADRECVPWYNSWDARELARQIRSANVDYVAFPRYLKSDLTMRLADPTPLVASIREYSDLVMAIPDPGDEGKNGFMLFKIERKALEGYLAKS
jgi:4-amino-4-deoxy-L-arabinose transferase-like glycosyltransferase